MEGFEPKSITAEEFEEKHVPLLNTIAELVMSHDDVPEEVEQADLLGALTTLTTELRASLTGRVPEHVKLQEELARKEKQVRKLQETNQALFLKVGSPADKAQDVNAEKPKKTFDEIREMINRM